MSHKSRMKLILFVSVLYQHLCYLEKCHPQQKIFKSLMNSKPLETRKRKRKKTPPAQCSFSSFCQNTVRRTPDNPPADRPETNMAPTKTQNAATAKTVHCSTSQCISHLWQQYAQNVAHVPLSQQNRVQATSLMTDRRRVGLHSINNMTHPFQTNARISVKMTESNWLQWDEIQHGLLIKSAYSRCRRMPD